MAPRLIKPAESLRGTKRIRGGHNDVHRRRRSPWTSSSGAEAVDNSNCTICIENSLLNSFPLKTIQINKFLTFKVCILLQKYNFVKFILAVRSGLLLAGMMHPSIHSLFVCSAVANNPFHQLFYKSKPFAACMSIPQNL
ncbi:hypothetical protein CDAR_407271 [Caerostris darwini]|uniref:Uncharacterized protein n=1 Tax=Caerostris darwini TaxID=1538125 RepID=A0AAV4Q1B7_9ARAC|nr:hypothetical protein CDAR_407271 [Caerostris darwini]